MNPALYWKMLDMSKIFANTRRAFDGPEYLLSRSIQFDFLFQTSKQIFRHGTGDICGRAARKFYLQLAGTEKKIMSDFMSCSDGFVDQPTECNFYNLHQFSHVLSIALIYILTV